MKVGIFKKQDEEFSLELGLVLGHVLNVGSEQEEDIVAD
jgi:hypothetical protein